MKKYIMSLDAGTTSNRCIIFNKQGDIVSLSQKEFTQYFPKPGWVEHDPIEIFSTMLYVCKDALRKAELSYENIEAIGITNQRETTVVWDKNTGEPIYNAIVWQCRRTSDYVDKIYEDKKESIFKQKTGLIPDAYFSATKIKWILDNVEGAKEKAKKGELLFGTIDTWLVYNLTSKNSHVTDYSNASRTMLFNINTLEWDEEILEYLSIEKSMLPEVLPSASIFGETDPAFFGGSIRISGILGDQQSALFGQTCFNKGDIKTTYGTGGFLLQNTGEEKVYSENGLLTTIAWGIGDKVTYALEGSIFVCGAAIQWLRDELKIIDSAEDSEKLAREVNDTNGCFVVPAFTGLGAPYWDQYARGAIIGLTRGVNKNHIVRATLESMAFQTADLVLSMKRDCKTEIKKINVDGGASNNNLLMQMQSDLLNCDVIRPKITETTALGAAYIAGLTTGFYKDFDDIKNNYIVDKVFKREMDEETRIKKFGGWRKAVKRSFMWEEEENE